MKREVDGMPRLLLATYRILIVIVIILGAVIAGGTVIALAGRRSAPTVAAEGTTGITGDLDARRSSQDAAGGRSAAYFTGVGRIRAATTDARPATVIVSIAFPYDKNDTAFSEELAARTRDFRQLAVELFSSYTGAQLRKLGEAELKTELLRRYNAQLRLGKIDTVYFNDYLIVE
jgi:flagellar protein FliL